MTEKDETEPRPSNDYVIARTTGTLVIGSLGGYVAALISLPLPWMIGAMLATTIAALSRAQIAGQHVLLPQSFRLVTVPVIGVMLGSGFTPEVAQMMVVWWPSVLGLFVFVMASVVSVYVVYRRFFGFDRPTAYFASIPGGVIESAVLGESAGGDARTISLIHFCRILLAVLCIPMAFRLVFGPVGSQAVGASAFETALSIGDVLWLIGAGVSGFYLGRLSRLPGAAISGPMIMSAIIHATGLTEAHPPTLIVIAAQIVLGSALGSRFLGYPLSRVAYGMRAAFAGFAIMVGYAVVIAMVMQHLVPEDIPGLLLAYAPGGLAEMSLIALSLQLSVPFVAAHHIARIIIAVMIPAYIYKWRIDPTVDLHR